MPTLDPPTDQTDDSDDDISDLSPLSQLGKGPSNTVTPSAKENERFVRKGAKELRKEVEERLVDVTTSSPEVEDGPGARHYFKHHEKTATRQQAYMRAGEAVGYDDPLLDAVKMEIKEIFARGAGSTAQNKGLAANPRIHQLKGLLDKAKATYDKKGIEDDYMPSKASILASVYCHPSAALNEEFSSVLIAMNRLDLAQVYTQVNQTSDMVNTNTFWRLRFRKVEQELIGAKLHYEQTTENFTKEMQGFREHLTAHLSAFSDQLEDFATREEVIEALKTINQKTKNAFNKHATTESVANLGKRMDVASPKTKDLGGKVTWRRALPSLTRLLSNRLP